MKLVVLLFFVTSIIFVACDKEEIVVVENFDIYQPLSIGSYWIYQHYRVDSLGTEYMLNKKDTVMVEGDSLLNGKMYKKISKEQYPLYPPLNKKIITFQKDSIHYIVNNNGFILFSSQDFDNVLEEEVVQTNFGGDVDTHRFKMEMPTDSIQVPIGIFSCLNYKRISTSTDSTMSVFYQNKYANKYFAKNVGMVLQTYPLFDGQYERRLIEYYIE